MLSELLGSKLRAKLLSWLLCHADERFFVRQLKGVLDEDATNIGRELARLEKLGILTCTREGREKYYRADTAYPIFGELQGIAVKTMRVGDVLRAALAPAIRG